MAGETTAWSGGRIFTGTRYVEALLTESGHVSAVGTDREIRRATPAGAEHRDLRGRLALPGLIDAHLHWADSVVAAVGADLRGARSLSELRGRLGDAAGRSSEGPVVGSGWDQERMAERRYPTRHDLDAEVPSRPVVLFRICQHVAVANSSALELMGIDRRSPDPPGGRIERESDGSANGVLVDAALRFLQPFVEEVFRSNHRAARGVLASASARGLTSLGLMRARAGELALGAEEGRAGRSRLALRFYVPPELVSSGSRRASGTSPEEDGVVGIKLVLDGSLGARTAWMDEPYHDAPEERGLSLLTETEAQEAVDSAKSAGLAVAVHAIGDRALHQAVQLAERNPGTIRIEHASVVPRQLEDRLVQLQRPIVVQPGFVESDSWIGERLGPARAECAYPIRRLVGRGVPVAGSSDAPVESMDPWVGLRILVDRIGLAPETALGLYTRGGATALAEPTRGHLEEGAVADIVIVDASDLESAIRLGGPVRTVVHRGRTVHGEGAI